MSNTLNIIYRIATAIVAAQGLIVADIAAFNIPARWISGAFGFIALIGLLAEFVVASPAKAAVTTPTLPAAPPAPPTVVA